MTRIKVYSILFFACIVSASFSQAEKALIRKGNRYYESGEYNNAEKKYSEALSKKNDNYKAIYNLGDAYYKQGKYAEAQQQFEIAASKKMSPDSLAMTYHNLGNSLLKNKKYEESIKAYKNALKNNPDDQDTRYNLAYAQKMLKQEQQKQNQNQDQKDQNKDQKQDQNKQDQKKEQKKEEQQKEQQAQNQLSKEDAARLLEALNNDEKKVQDKLKKQKGRANSAAIDKDW